jgi:putative protein-disulfide isomerase
MQEKYVEIIQFTDPVCTWCWGSEPVVRALETRFGSQIKIKYVMGGLVKDIFAFYDSFNDIGGDPDRSNRQIALHWLEASKRHGMPVMAEGFNLFSKQNPSTYPQNIAYKAAQLQGAEKADRFLRRLREASAAEAKITSSMEVLIELTSETGLEISQFISDFTSGKAEENFKEDLYLTSKYNVRAFPSFLIKYGDKTMMLRGFNNYASFKTLIGNISNGEISEAAPVEVKMAFNLTDNEYRKIESSLLEKMMVKKKEAGNGYFLIRKVNTMAYDSDTRICSL